MSTEQDTISAAPTAASASAPAAAAASTSAIQEGVAKSPKVQPTHHFGRGGAGNKTAKDAKSPLLPPAITPTIKGDVYTTGRGGTGNMAKNDPERPEAARAAQDVDDVPEMLLPEGPRTIGRGGAANVHKPTEEEKALAQKNNGRFRRESSPTKEKEKASGLKAFARSSRDLLMGRSSKESVVGNKTDEDSRQS